MLLYNHSKYVGISKANTNIFLGQAYGQKLLCSKLPLSQIVFASYANFDMPKCSFQNLDYL